VCVYVVSFWFFANYTYNLSLSKTSVSSNTILSSTSGLFTLILGAITKTDKFSILKLFSVAMSFGGVVLVTLVDTKNSGTNSMFGDFLALASAVGYAMYAILLKMKIPNEKSVHMPMFFGFVGIFNTVLLWPLGFILSVTGIEVFVWPNGEVLGFVIANGIIGSVISDLLWMNGVLLTSPLIATVGISLTVPLAMLSDIILHDKKFTISYFFGSVLVVSGFLFVNFEEKN